MRVVRESKRTPWSTSARAYRETIRAQVFGHYGLTCACCGTAENLSIDHVNGDGRQHREEVLGEGRIGDSYGFYRWLINTGFPDGFQTLCRPCNASKWTGEHCRLDHAAA